MELECTQLQFCGDSRVKWWVHRFFFFIFSTRMTQGTLTTSVFCVFIVIFDTWYRSYLCCPPIIYRVYTFQSDVNRVSSYTAVLQSLFYHSEPTNIIPLSLLEGSSLHTPPLENPRLLYSSLMLHPHVNKLQEFSGFVPPSPSSLAVPRVQFRADIICWPTLTLTWRGQCSSRRPTCKKNA